MTTFIIYTKDNCSWCRKLKELLSDNEFTYIERHYPHDFSRDDLARMLGRTHSLTLPQVYDTMNNHIGNYEDFVKFLEKDNV